MVRHVLAIERLSHAVAERRMLWALCKNCGHAVRLDPRHLIALKGDVTLRDLQGKCHCKRCGRQSAAIVVADMGWPGRD
jgi:hypothetical protein